MYVTLPFTSYIYVCMLCYNPPYQISVHFCLGYMLRHSANRACIRTLNIRTAVIMNSRNSSSTHSKIPRRCICI